MEKDTDMVNSPPHYTQGKAKCPGCQHPIECIDVVRHMGFNKGNIIKYLWRADDKGKMLEDLKKARWYLNDLIETLGGKAGND